MSLLPSPIPHPLEFSPFDVPGWAYEALEWVVGFDWPAGNEVATWDVADRWYVLAKDLAEPHDATFEAATKILAGYGGSGITADGFRNAWQQLAGDENAPLNALLHIADSLGELVEGCGRDLEAAKLEAWIEIGIFLTELIGMAIAVALTFGAASPAAGGLIMATRMAIQQIFKRLIEQLGKKALKATAKRAVKEITTKQGLGKLGKKALHEGLDEAREEVATNSGIQLYQESTGRAHGFSFTDLGLSAAGGFAGGAAASGSGVGAHGHHGGVARSAGGEVLAEFGASAVFGDLPGLQDVAKAGTSGAAGSAMASTVNVPSIKIDSVLRTPEGPFDLDSAVVLGGSPDGMSSPSFSSLADGSSPDGGHSASSGSSSPLGSFAGSLGDSSSHRSSMDLPQTSTNATADPGTSVPRSLAEPATAGPPAAVSASSTSLSATSGTVPGSHVSDISPSSPSDSSASAARPDPALAGASPVPATSAAVQIPSSPSDLTSTPGASTTRPPLSDLDRIAAALGPRIPASTAIPRQVPVFPTFSPTHQPARPQHFPRPHTNPIRNETGYFGYAHHARRTHELNRRDEYITYLTGLAEESRAKTLSLGREADLAFRAGLTLRGEDLRRRAVEFRAIVDGIETQIDHVRTGRMAPAKVEVGPNEWARINTDVGDLAPGGVQTDDRSALTGNAGRPPIDRTRHYNTVGGLRAPLAVHQTDLEEAVPRDGDGRPQRLPDPRAGRWFRLANDGGPEADPTRALNCVDGVLALFDTYIHGRPRVSAPRTFDTYAHGNPDRPLGGEANGVRRIQTATGTTFQNLCPYVGRVGPAAAKPAMDVALRNLTNHLLNTGHGAYAFIITDMEAGGSHAWAATNHHGSILFLDPQVGRISENMSLYSHRGVHANTNITSMDALVVDGSGAPAPLPHHGPGQRAAAPAGTPDETPAQPRSPKNLISNSESAVERQAFESLSLEERTLIRATHERSQGIADRILADLRHIVAVAAPAPDGVGPKITGEEHRTKEPHSIARAFLDDSVIEQPSLDQFLAGTKDLVRFSVEVSEAGYGQSVVGVLQKLAASGYRVQRLLSFWAPQGRHNGLNVTLSDPVGNVFELQFPTPLTSSVGKQTHTLYERVRSDRFSVRERVDALLKIFSLNKEFDLSAHQPSDLDALLELDTRIDVADTTFSHWTEKKRRVWTRYLAALEADGMSLNDVLARHHLTRGDVFGPSGGQGA